MNTQPSSIEQEVEELFARARSIPDIIRRLQKINDPKARINITQELKDYWHTQEKLCHDKTGYHNSCGQWQYTWPTIDTDLATVIQQAKQQTTPKPTIPTTIKPTTPKTPTTMPKKSTVHITNNFYGSIGQHIDHIDTQHVTFDKDMNMHIEHVQHQHQPSTPSPSTTANTPSPDLDKFRSLLTIPYLNRKRECEAMLEFITRPGYNKKDRARFALALYQSGNVALQREHIATFRQWCRICCELLGWDPTTANYNISELKANDATRQIKIYL